MDKLRRKVMICIIKHHGPSMSNRINLTSNLQLVYSLFSNVICSSVLLLRTCTRESAFFL